MSRQMYKYNIDIRYWLMRMGGGGGGETMVGMGENETFRFDRPSFSSVTFYRTCVFVCVCMGGGVLILNYEFATR